MEVLGANIDRLRKATKKAFSRTNAITGQSTVRRNLKLYETMDEATLKALGARYGQENLLRYIKHMEALRMNNGNS